ncbi:MAG: CHASE domain-containing protein [Alphaproteobacteria bacterium]|nr:CHASE domain-containing protein [Alphaproteobacteria bacterium]
MWSAKRKPGPYAPIAIIALLGLLLTAGSMILFERAHQREQTARFGQEVGERASLLAERLNRDVSIIRGVDSYASVTPGLTGGQFRAFAREQVRDAEVVQVLEWISVLHDHERPMFEARMRAMGYRDFRIREFDDSGRLVPAATRERYLPVTQVEPLAGNEAVLGLDLASDPKRAEALRKACQEDRAIITPQLRLAQEGTGVLVVSPVHAPGEAATCDEGLRGYVVGLFRISLIVRKALEGSAPYPVDLYLYDEDAADGALHYEPSALHVRAPAPLSKAAVLAGPHLSLPIAVAGRTWSLVARPLPELLAAPRPFLPWVPLAGLVMTAGICAYLAGGESRHRRQRLLTEALAASNARLEDEAAVRGHVEENLKVRTLTLSRRVREVNGLYALSKLSTDPALGWRQVCRQAVDLLPRSAGGVEDAGARVTVEGEVFESGGFRALGRRVSCPVLADGRAVGEIELFLLDDGGGDDNAFLSAAAEILGRHMHAHRTQKALEAAKASAERATEAKARFFAAASHDLRQPLQAMHLFLHILRQRLDDPKSIDIAAKLGEAMKTADGLLDALLQVGRLDAGTVQAEPTEFAVGDLLTRLGDEFSLQARAKNLRLAVVKSSVAVRSDPVLLGRVLGNLLSNALRYTRRGGVVLGARRRGNMLRLMVVDSGIGIQPHEVDSIFQEFYQVSNPERDQARGLGLGLAIVDRMARLLGHQVQVASVPGRGSCFCVDVPIAAGPIQAPVAPVTTDSPALVGLLVAVVENEPSQREGLDLLLTQWGCTVVSGASAEEVVSGLARRRPDLVLSDFRLKGGQTGLDAARRILTATGAAAPCVILTGDTSAERIKQAQQSGFRLLHKPVDPPVLMALLRDLARRERRRAAI